MKQEIIKQISQIIPKERIKTQEPMMNHTTFRVGGPAALFVDILNPKELGQVLTLLKHEEEDYYLIGNGSNLLVSDTGYDGVILHLAKEFNHVTVDASKCLAVCQAGATLASIARTVCENGLAEFEFAAGIPGSLGGAIVMNAGAYGGEMKQAVESVRLMSPDGVIVEKSAHEMNFSYRHSILKEEEYKAYVVVDVTLKLEKGNTDEIKEKMSELAEKRREKQPLEFPSAGSTFKRPEGYFAAKLIEEAGLRGFSVGGAQVSEKHCGFVINKGNATASDVYLLMQRVSETVREKSGVTLEPEVILLGEF